MAETSAPLAYPSSKLAVAKECFAVRTLVDLQRAGADIHAHIGTLSIYLGHVKPAGTYWYLSAAPELMELAAARLERGFGDGR